MTYRAETLATGKTFEIGGGGEFFQCHYATAEVEFRVMIGDQMGGWTPLDRGIGWDKSWTKIEIRNETGTTQTIGVVYHAEKGYFDSRELAASIAVTGGIVTNTAPSMDQGGSVREIGQSLINTTVDLTGLAGVSTTVLTAAMNVGGVRVRRIRLFRWALTASQGRSISLSTPARDHINEYWTAADSNSHRVYDEVFDLPAGGEIALALRGEDLVSIMVAYDNL